MVVSGYCIAEKVKSTRYSWDGLQRGSHPYVIIQWTLSGTGIFETQNKKYEVGPGKAFVTIVPENSRYYYPQGARDPWVFSWLNLSGNLAVHLWGQLQRKMGSVMDLSGQTSVQLLFEELARKTEGKRWRDPQEMHQRCFEFFLDWEQAVSSPRKVKGGGLEWTRDLLRSDFRGSLAVKELADRLGWSREHFSREYQKRFRITPGAELRERRFEEACRLLKSTTWTTQMVARRSGFSNATQMGLCFQKKLRMTPTTYRQKAG